MTTSIRHTTFGILYRLTYSDGKIEFLALLLFSWFTIGTQTSEEEPTLELSLVERHRFISGCRLRGRDSLSCKKISITWTILLTTPYSTDSSFISSIPASFRPDITKWIIGK